MSGAPVRKRNTLRTDRLPDSPVPQGIRYGSAEAHAVATPMPDDVSVTRTTGGDVCDMIVLFGGRLVRTLPVHSGSGWRCPAAPDGAASESNHDRGVRVGPSFDDDVVGRLGGLASPMPGDGHHRVLGLGDSRDQALHGAARGCEELGAS